MGRVNVYDQSGRLALHHDPNPVVRHLTRKVTQSLSPEEAEQWQIRFVRWADTRTVALPGEGDRTADRVSIMELLSTLAISLWIWEIQTKYDAEKFFVLFEEAGRLLARYATGPNRPNVLPVLIQLKGDCPLANTQLDMRWAGLGICCDFLVWIVSEDDADTVLTEVETGVSEWPMLYWIPLMDGGHRPEIVARWLKLVAIHVPENRRDELVAVVLLFAETAGCFLTWEEILKVEPMTESPLVNSWIGPACEQAELKGVQASLLRVLRNRFRSLVTNDVVEAVNTQKTLDILYLWMDAASLAPSWDMFREQLRHCDLVEKV